MNRTHIEIHVLQTVPPSNINRDDTGSPKTATYGGVRRARVSSQAWKRATRVRFESYLDRRELGQRTKRVVEALAERIREQDPDLADRARELAVETIRAVGIEVKAPQRGSSQRGIDASKSVEEAGYLVFLSRVQIDNLAAAAVAASRTDDVQKSLREAKVKDIANRDHSIDIALFGRMVTDQKDISVDAAAQVAHAISVHPVETEFDYFTALDDRSTEEESGAGMIGVIEFNSSTLYRYATVDANRLLDNLGNVEATGKAAAAFVEAFVRSMPTGKQNTFANRTLPEAVLVQVRDTQPINLVGAFENPIRETEVNGRVKLAAEALRDEAAEVARAYGEKPIASWVTRIGPDTDALDDLGPSLPLAELVDELNELVHGRLSGHQVTKP